TGSTATTGSRATPAESAGVRVAPLRRVVPPDLLVVGGKPLRRRAVKAVTKLPGVVEVTRVSAGTARVGGGRVSLLGVDPSTFRAWTPPPSAESDALWRALAYDQLVLSFHARRARDVRLGRRYDVAGARVVRLRLGAVAAIGLPGVDGLVTPSTAGALGLTKHAGLLINAPSARIGKLARAVHDAVGHGVSVRKLRRDVQPVPSKQPGGKHGQARIPLAEARTYLQLYQLSAQRCPGLSWTVLAAIGQVESGHGQNMGPSSAGALGPMQFLPSTWQTYGVDGDGDGSEDIANPYDAIPAAADYLCRAGAGEGGQSLYDAVYAYNHSDSYVQQVLALAEQYAEHG
ncbi:MAG: lytic murein transglycosylase, partial [Streptosporangiales bacterium]